MKNNLKIQQEWYYQIRRYLEKGHYTVVTTNHVLIHALGIEPTPARQARVAAILSRLGWLEANMREPGGDGLMKVWRCPNPYGMGAQVKIRSDRLGFPFIKIVYEK